MENITKLHAYYEELLESEHIPSQEVADAIDNGGMIPIAKIYEVRDLDLLSYKHTNRDVEKHRVLKADILKAGIIQPLLVNLEFQVLDGQHRLAIAKELGIPVPIIFKVETVNDEQIMRSLNTTNKKWNIGNHVDLNIKRGSINSKKLKELKQMYPTCEYSSLLALVGVSKNNLLDDKFSLSESTYNQALNVIRVLHQLTDNKVILRKILAAKGIKVLARLIALKNFDEERLRRNILYYYKHKTLTTPSGSTGAARMWLDIYNHNVIKNNRLPEGSLT